VRHQRSFGRLFSSPLLMKKRWIVLAKAEDSSYTAAASLTLDVSTEADVSSPAGGVGGVSDVFIVFFGLLPEEF
jgi:hypothetical protein